MAIGESNPPLQRRRLFCPINLLFTKECMERWKGRSKRKVGLKIHQLWFGPESEGVCLRTQKHMKAAWRQPDRAPDLTDP